MNYIIYKTINLITGMIYVGLMDIKHIMNVVQRLSRKGVHSSEWKHRDPYYLLEGCDIVQSYKKL
jgi:hypothetical protein